MPQSKIEEVKLIAIVDSPYSSKTSWYGSVTLDEDRGYVGRLVSELTVESFELLLNRQPPPDLKKDTLFCLIDGSDPATAFQPIVGAPSIKTNGSRSVHIQFPALVHGLHILANDRLIRGVRLQSPLFTRLRNITPINSDTTDFPFTHVTANKADPFNFSCTFGNGFFDVKHFPTGGGKDHEVGIKAYGIAEINFTETSTMPEAISLIEKFEQFISLICFSFVRSESSALLVESDNVEKAESDNKDIDKSNSRLKRCTLRRGNRNINAKLDLNWHEIPIHVTDIDFGKSFSKFLETHDKLYLALGWYRIATAERRYVEDLFFYSVRMIESVHRAFGETLSDDDALAAVNKIRDRLIMREDSDDLAEFCDNRVGGIFRKSNSLADIIRGLKKSYSDIPVVELLDERLTRDLRGREAHGPSSNLTNAEESYMYFAYEVFSMLFVCVVLERCSISREALILGLSKCPAYRSFFEPTLVEKIRESLAR